MTMMEIIAMEITEKMRLNEISIDEIRAWSQNISDRMLSQSSIERIAHGNLCQGESHSML
jgi:hypothetical protein